MWKKKEFYCHTEFQFTLFFSAAIFITCVLARIWIIKSHLFQNMYWNLYMGYFIPCFTTARRNSTYRPKKTLLCTAKAAFYFTVYVTACKMPNIYVFDFNGKNVISWISWIPYRPVWRWLWKWRGIDYWHHSSELLQLSWRQNPSSFV